MALVGADPPVPSIIVQVSTHGKLVHVQPGKQGQWQGTKNAGLARRKPHLSLWNQHRDSPHDLLFTELLRCGRSVYGGVDAPSNDMPYAVIVGVEALVNVWYGNGARPSYRELGEQ